jgi:hypothetical protein
MRFTVYTNASGDSEEFDGAAVYSVQDSGALVVRPDEGGRVTYGPSGWLRVEEPPDQSEQDPPIRGV